LLTIPGATASLSNEVFLAITGCDRKTPSKVSSFEAGK
jgi:hypothetical protein